MNRRPTLCSRQFRASHLPKFLFLFSVLLSIATTYYVSAHYIDSDTSSELVLSNHLIETRKLLSSDWFYATELRLLHVQWIYVPLMLLLDDWLMVRFLGALIMQALYIGSFGYLVYAAGKSKQFFFYGASLLLLPVSVAYGRIILYHNHYLPNITVSFLLLALTMHFTDAVDWRSKKTWLHLVLLAILSFVSSINSVRQLMITHAPLLVVAFVFCWIEDNQNNDNRKAAILTPSNLTFLFCTVYSALFAFAGLKFQRILCNKLGLKIVARFENNLLSFSGFDCLEDIFYAFFHQFGYREMVPMLSAIGILGLASIFIGCYLIIISAKKLLQSNPCQNRPALLLTVFFLAHTAVMVITFLLTSKYSGDYYYPLYLSLCFPWAVPLILSHLEYLSKVSHPLHIKKLFAMICVGALFLSSAVNHFYFQGNDRFPQTYEGLLYDNKELKSELTEVVDFLMEQGYDKGYASYWNCNVIAEMTSGKIPMTLIHDLEDTQSGNLKYRDWLCSIQSREAPCEKPFLLLEEKWAETFQQSDSYIYCTPIYSGPDYIAYSISDPDAFAKILAN